MPYEKIALTKLNLDRRLELLKKKCGREFPKILEFIRNARVRNDISKRTERKYLDVFTMVYNNIEHGLANISRRTLEDLKQDLNTGKIKSRFGKPYSDTSIRDMTLILSKYLMWKDPKKYGDLPTWFVTKVKKRTPEVLKEEEIARLFSACKTDADRYLVCVLFDSGFRIAEFVNLRFEDIIEPTQSFPYYKIDLKGEYSKTEGRTIGLYWKHSTDAIRAYLSTIDRSDPKAQVFPKAYDAIRMFLGRLGKRILGRRIHPHMFRKSSATYYAGKLKSRQQLCYRYGWRFSSDCPDIYIARAGMQEEEVKDVLLSTDLQRLEKENHELKTKFALMSDQMQGLADVEAQMKVLLQAIKKNPKAATERLQMPLLDSK